MKHETLRNYIRQIVSEDIIWNTDRSSRSGGKEKGWFQNFLSFFRNDKGQATEAADAFFDDFEERTLIELPETFKARVYAFSEKKFPFAMKKAEGDEVKARRLMIRVISNTFSPELRKIRDAMIDDHDDYML